MSVRFVAFKCKRDAFKDAWFLFDFILVLLMVWETWVEVGLFMLCGNLNSWSPKGASILRVLRVIRITRVARMARLLSSFPELMILLKAILLAVRSVCSTLFLLIITVYVFAVAFVQTLSGTEAGQGCFDSVPLGMHCLIMNGILSSQADIINKMLSAGLVYYVGMLVYALLAALTLGNMLIGVICEVVGSVADVERERVMVGDVKHTIGRLLFHIDADHSRTISKSEFVSMLGNQEAIRRLNDVGVDPVALVDYAEFIFKVSGSYNMENSLRQYFRSVVPTMLP